MQRTHMFQNITRRLGAAVACLLGLTVTGNAQPGAMPIPPALVSQAVAVGSAKVDVAAIDRQRILRAAEAALKCEPITITAFTAKLSEGGPNDFYSNGDYWWPDPTKPDGLPYIQRDGESNPGNFFGHRRCVMQLRDTIAALGAAYRLTGEDRYARKAAELLRAFFLDSKTRMNPHLKYAQAIPGRTAGRGTGIIDTLHLAEVAIAVRAMQRSPELPPTDLAGLRQWFGDYLDWMLTSKNGQEEANAGNNHSVAFWLQVAAFARLTGDEARLAQCRKQFQEVFVVKQMALDGSFPAELRRTKPYGYSIFQLDNMATLCQMLSTPQLNLWSYTLPDGRGIRKAMEYLYPYLADKSKWPKQPDIQAWDGWPARQPCLLFAGLGLGEQSYLDLWKRLPPDPSNAEVRRNLAITQPLLWVDLPAPNAIVPSGPAKVPEIRTPKPSAAPRINGPGIFGVRPGHPFLYRIPATGDRPMEFSVESLPSGLRVDKKTGQITGVLAKAGEQTVTLCAANSHGANSRKFKIVVGETIALTPPLGWNSWNCWGPKVDADKVLRSARAMVASGLDRHGWTYINIDDAWQGKRGGKFNGLQGNEKFPDIELLCAQIHDLGLKVGIYSTPWVTSYAEYPGGSAENREGTWEKPAIPKKGNVNKKRLPWAIGKYSFAVNDARQWAAWGIDYLKYDWNPNEEPETREMYQALRESGRDIVFSLSNSMPFTNAPALSQLANCWRTSGDIRDNWQSMSSKGFGLDRWAPYQSPGHWNDPDMLVVGYVGGWGGRPPKLSGLTPDELYTHITLWSLVCSPLLIGCDLERLDGFTLNLLGNDEVLAVHQDALGKQALGFGKDGDLRVYARDLEDGAKAVGLFNTGSNVTATVTAQWADLKLTGKQRVRDVWRQKDLGEFEGYVALPVAPHGAELIKITPVR